MFRKHDQGPDVDAMKLNGELRAAYLELLSAQCAVDRLKHRYTPEMVARNGGSFMLLRSISAATAMFEYFRQVEQQLPGEKTKSRV